MAIGVEPAQERTNATLRQGDTRVCGAVVEIGGVSIRDRISAREDHVLNVTVAFILRFRRENPGIAANQTLLRILQIKERQS
jgi:hypothetical protein